MAAPAGSLAGSMLLGGTQVTGAGPASRAIDPSTGATMAPDYPSATVDDVATACRLAAEAFEAFRATDAERRAAFLEATAAEIDALGDELLERAHAETGLPLTRLTGERERTTGQLRLFAEVLREGSWNGARIDRAQPDRAPAPRPDIRQRRIPLGPVAVFGASNFPLAFSVAGGDTASALAAGCPVVVKAHEAHPGTSELVGRAVTEALGSCGLPAGTFSLLFGDGPGIGTALVGDPRIRAVGFTGSRRAGLSIAAAAAQRPRPIPVYAEMSSINPVFLLPDALATRGSELARGYVASMTLGAGQFCTNPGIVLAVDGPALTSFLDQAAAAVAGCPPAAMLTPAMAGGYEDGVTTLAAEPGVELLARGPAEPAPTASCRPALFCTSGERLLASPALQQEVFGASSVVVRCTDGEELVRVAAALEGQLTATLHATDADLPLAARLLPVLELRAGRILFNGWPTGVEVGHAMVHGGPFPATSDARSTSVGSLAIERFLRPVAYQDLPATLLPAAIADGNPEGIWRLVDGELRRD